MCFKDDENETWGNWVFFFIPILWKRMDTNAHGLCKCNDYLYSAQIKIWDCSWPHSQVSWPEFSYQEITFRLCETYWLIFPSQKICVILSRISKNLLHLMNIGWVSPLSPCLFSLSRLSLPPFSFFFFTKKIYFYSSRLCGDNAQSKDFCTCCTM